MSKVLYDVIEGAGRKVRKQYGVLDGSTRKIKRSYDVVDGVTRMCCISQLPASITPSVTSLSATVKANATKTFTITTVGDGALSVVSSKTSVATATITGTTVTIKCLKTGSATITVNMAESENYSAASCEVALSVTIIGTLNATSWATIKSVASSGANYWSVGDRKAVAVSGTVGAITISGTYYVYILGFNHNSSIEGKGIHFQFGFTAASGGVNIAFADSNHDTAGTSAGFRMYLSRTGTGGWTESYMCKTICPAFLSALPSALRSAIAACTKYTDNVGDGSGAASNVSAASSKIWLMSEYELRGQVNYLEANPAEKSYQAQYAYYANGNSKVKYSHSDTATAVHWWNRSPDSNLAGSFCRTSKYGGITCTYADYSVGFAPCFKVA